eukprot:8520908-Alexandrium_andersonii.AAC.1
MLPLDLHSLVLRPLEAPSPRGARSSLPVPSGVAGLASSSDFPRPSPSIGATSAWEAPIRCSS